MSKYYFITSEQLGLINFFTETKYAPRIKKIINEIYDKQVIGETPDSCEDYETIFKVIFQKKEEKDE